MAAAMGLAAALAGCASAMAVGSATGLITPQEYTSRYVQGAEGHLLLDVRTAEEFAQGHIPGAVNISVQELGDRLSEVPRDEPVVVYCRSGNRSATAAQLLRDAGYTAVFDLGGIRAWQDAGLPVE
jgi:rhodanese-related sulfurtransferase